MVKAFALNKNDAERLKKIYNGSGIDFRYSVLPDFLFDNSLQNTFFGKAPNLEPFPDTEKRLKLYQATAADIAAAAVRQCLTAFKNDITPTITHLITVSCTGMYAPGIDIDLVEKLGLNHNIERTCINFMGCYGAVNALKAADYICKSDNNARVLVVSIELCTLHFQKTSTLDNWIANSLFSDGAAAVLVEHTLKRDTKTPCLVLNKFYADIIPGAKGDMGWLIGNFGFEMKLTSRVSKHVKNNIKVLTGLLLKAAGLTIGQIDIFAIHPGGRGILGATEDSLSINNLANQYSYKTLKNYGNMSSATILFVLKEILNADIEEGQKIVSFAFGPGLSFEGMILETSK